ncbi:hypothetical protein C0J52_24038 [Blattella germanica]|nr:hypothetical protein C0J52_24038 [Blattella germanica]
MVCLQIMTPRSVISCTYVEVSPKKTSGGCNPKDFHYMRQNTVICCEQDNGNDLVQATADGFQLQEGEIVSSRVFNYILRQKDILIKELYSKIEILNEEVKLLKNVHELKSELKTKCNSCANN